LKRRSRAGKWLSSLTCKDCKESKPEKGPYPTRNSGHVVRPACIAHQFHRRFDVEDRALHDDVRPSADAIERAKAVIVATLAAHREDGKAAIDVDLTEFD
jgi:hypothetical protein